MSRIKVLISAIISKTPVLVWMLFISILLHIFVILGIKPEAGSSNQGAIPKVMFKINLEQESQRSNQNQSVNSNLESAPISNDELVVPPQQNLIEVPIDEQLLDKFYKAKELDILPKPIGEVQLEYPPAINDQILSGTVRIEIFIDDDGDVVSIGVVDTTLPKVFEEAAIEAFRDMKFEPGIFEGKAVKTHIKMTVGFGY